MKTTIGKRTLTGNRLCLAMAWIMLICGIYWLCLGPEDESGNTTACCCFCAAAVLFANNRRKRNAADNDTAD